MQKKIYHISDYCHPFLPLAVWDEKTIWRKHWGHEHDSIEIMFVYRGSGVCGIDNVHYPMLPGSLYVIFEGEQHDYSSDVGMHFYNIMFTQDFFVTAEEKLLYRMFMQKFQTQKMLLCNYEGRNFILQLLARIKFELGNQDALSAFGSRILFLEFIFYVTRNFSQNAIRRTSNQKELQISRICDYVENHYKGKISLKQLAAITHYSQEYTGRIFKAATGMNLSTYISRVRLEKSTVDLKNSDKTIQEIALEHGFYDTAYYSRMFQRFYGLTPGKYRKGK